MSKRVLIFGVGGFVGTYAAREFHENGYEIFGCDRSENVSVQGLAGFVPVDITDASQVAHIIDDIHPDVIINLAAISSVGLSWRSPQATVDVNVIGTVNILEAALRLSPLPKILLIGSSEEYAPSDLPLAEDSALDASNPYGISKVAQENFAQLYVQRYSLPVYIVRSFNHTGVGQTDSFVLPSWCKQVACIERSGGDGILKVGNLEVVRDFSDVRDIVRAYRMIVESDQAGEAFNVGSGVGRSLKDLLATIVSFSDADIKIEVDPGLLRPSDNPIIVCDSSKITHALGWIPEHSVDATLREIYDEFIQGC